MQERGAYHPRGASKSEEPTAFEKHARARSLPPSIGSSWCLRAFDLQHTCSCHQHHLPYGFCFGAFSCLAHVFCCVVHWLSLPPCRSACGRIILALIGRSSKQSAWRRRVFTISRLMKSGRRSRARSPPGGSNGMTVGAGIGPLIHGRKAIGHGGLDGSGMNLVDGLVSLPPRKCRQPHQRVGRRTGTRR